MFTLRTIRRVIHLSNICVLINDSKYILNWKCYGIKEILKPLKPFNV